MIIEESWSEKRLGNLINYRKGFAFKAKDYTAEGIPIVRVSNFTSNSIDMSDCLFLSKELEAEYTNVELLSGDVVIATVGSWPNNPASIVGKVIKVPEKANHSLLNQNAVRLRSNSLIEQEYLYYRLKCSDFSSYLVSGAQGSANQASITLEQIFDFKFNLPSILEQKKISQILSSLDAKIEINSRMNETLEQIAQAIFKRWFIDFEFPDEKGKPYKSSGGEIVDSELGEIPSLWQVKTIDEIASVKGGGTPRTNNEQYWQEGQINWATPKDLSGLQFPILLNTERLITADGLASITSELFPPGTLLLSSRAPIGYLAIAKVPTAINQGIIAVICNKGISYLFMLNWLKFNLEYIKSVANGSTFMEVSKSNFRTLKIIIPDIRVLDLFEITVDCIYTLMTNNEINTTELKRVRDLLLPKLITGEIRVPLNTEE